MQVFFSYSLADREFALQLAKEITSRGLRVWMSADELLPGENPWLTIGKALEDSHALVVLLSPESVKSELLNSELEYAWVMRIFGTGYSPSWCVQPSKFPGS